VSNSSFEKPIQFGDNEATTPLVVTEHHTAEDYPVQVEMDHFA
jgi:hypothetical protein